MARTSITPFALLGAYAAYSAGTATKAGTAATGSSGSSGNQFVASGNDLVIAWNSGSTGRTVTITAAADPQGRTRHITSYALAAGDHAFFGPFRNTGWVQTDGYVYLEANHADVKFFIVQL